MSTPVAVPPQTPGQEIQNLFTQRGELTYQRDVAIAKLQAVDQRLFTILNAGQPTA